MSTVADERKIRNGRREPEVRARPCDKCGSTLTKVDKTMGRIRYCLCKACGHRWRQTPEG